MSKSGNNKSSMLGILELSERPSNSYCETVHKYFWELHLASNNEKCGSNYRLDYHLDLTNFRII